jgi:hypothetical protein
MISPSAAAIDVADSRARPHAAIGRAAGPPWAVEQRHADAAAWLVLG